MFAVFNKSVSEEGNPSYLFVGLRREDNKENDKIVVKLSSDEYKKWLLNPQLCNNYYVIEDPLGGPNTLKEIVKRKTKKDIELEVSTTDDAADVTFVFDHEFVLVNVSDKELYSDPEFKTSFYLVDENDSLNVVLMKTVTGKNSEIWVGPSLPNVILWVTSPVEDVTYKLIRSDT